MSLIQHFRECNFTVPTQATVPISENYPDDKQGHRRRREATRRARWCRTYTYGGRGDPVDVSPPTLRHSVTWRMLCAEEDNTLYDIWDRLRHTTIHTTERK